MSAEAGIERRSLGRLLLTGFLGALVLYVLGFAFNEHLRARHGPWVVDFGLGPEGEPCLRVRQDHLRISNVTLTFPDQRLSNVPPVRVRFEVPRQSLPFGRVKYDDLTYLPGVVTMDVFGHELELLPRTLYVDRHEIPWVSGTNIVVAGPGQPAASP